MFKYENLHRVHESVGNPPRSIYGGCWEQIARAQILIQYSKTCLEKNTQNVVSPVEWSLVCDGLSNMSTYYYLTPILLAWNVVFKKQVVS